MRKETTDTSLKKWLSTDAGNRFAGRSISSELTLSLQKKQDQLDDIIRGHGDPARFYRAALK